MSKSKEQKKFKIVGINGRFTHSCLPLFYVRNELDSHLSDFDSELLQFTINDNYYEMLLRLSADNPDYILFSSAIWNCSLVERLSLDLCKCLPSCNLVIGGPQAAVLAERLGPDVCTVVIGEIEAIGEGFYRDMQEGELKPHYHGSIFKIRDKFFSYPYRKSDFTDHLKNRHIYYESSKGCPFSCSYCLSAAEKGLYHKELEVVQRELLDILSYKPKIIRFIDRTFNDIPDRALAIWKFLIANGGETLFHFEMAPDRFTEEMFAFLETVELGRFQFELGIQSTHDKTLEAIHRRVDPDEAHRTVRRLASFGNIHLHVDLILGLPFETCESFSQSFRDIFAMEAHYIQMGLLKILPDTPVFHQAVDFGYQFCNEPPYSVLQTKWMDHSTLGELYWFSECVEKFINNRYFTSLWNYLRRSEEDIFTFFNTLLSICQDSGFFQLAATQELMCTKIVGLIAERDDRTLIVELLRYDWLRCGFRFLPDCLMMGEDEEQPEKTRSRLYQSLPQEIPGAYNKSYRNQFFRKSFFLRTSKDALEQAGLASPSEEPCLCVLGQREQSLHKYNKVMVF